MGFLIDDVLEIVQIAKEFKNAEFHIATGDIKLSLYKGEISSSLNSAPDMSNTSHPSCLTRQPES